MRHCKFFVGQMRLIPDPVIARPAMESARTATGPNLARNAIQIILAWLKQELDSPGAAQREYTNDTMDSKWTPKQIIWVGDDSGLPGIGDSKTMQGSMVGVGNLDVTELPSLPSCFQSPALKYITAEAGKRWTFEAEHHKEIHQSIIVASEMGRIAGWKSSALAPTDITRSTIKQMKNYLNERQISYTGAKKRQQYIDLVMVSEMAAAEQPVSYWPWDRLLTCLEGDSNDKIKNDTLILFVWSGFPELAEIRTVYQKLEQLTSNGTNIRCYPKFGDLHESERKLGDIAALDKIAHDAHALAYKYRPATCSGSEGCILTGPSVAKRTHSAGGEHVKLSPKDDAMAKLRCRAPRLLVKLKVVSAALVAHESAQPICNAVWFHQEKVSSFVDFGEFKVIIVNVADVNGTRGTTGAVFEAFLTQPREGHPTEPTVSVLNRVADELLSREYCGDRTYRDLEDFALFVYEELRKYGQARTQLGNTAPDQETHEGGPAVGSGKRRRSASDHVEGPVRKVPRLERGDAEQLGILRGPAVFVDTSKTTGVRAQNSATPINTHNPTNTEGTEDTSAARSSVSATSHPHPYQSDVADATIPVSSRTSARVEEDTFYRETMFDSLEVAVRLDIGISSKEDGHRFFVNEITGEWYGDLISYRTGEPRTRICTAIAESRARYLLGVGRGVSHNVAVGFGE